ncbi:urate hydroxylase PuuD [Piscinibacter sakaiensis]|uniref:Membrane protein related to purine degradation n=1 Tax=Piscinibacter sakaiensis TaxID=1547922 RepID=A0A0K8P8K7_PISS1|nr:urate hydroxylase PuuD [Piscinibacter sakaiensis]GAP38971.1 membrane protein related to purine degradation [Piscinibacter sakaiensis]
MDAYLLDWANLLLRWLHVITAIAWIGASLHFVLLDDSLHRPTDPELLKKGVDGEAWAVHGGGFYHSNKYMVAPANLPDKLHWSFWESYSTWLSGFALLTVLYFFNASSFLVDKRVFDWSPGAAIAGALAYLVLGWVVYDAICRYFGRTRDGSVGGDAKVGVLVFVYTCVAAYVACQLFAGRAAFLLTGAMLATVMSANVFMVIIPGQRKVVAAMRAGQPVDPNHGRRGKQRSVHNTYFTLPVIIAMLSNHYGMVYQHAWNWVVLILLMLAGALIRLFFVLRHKGPNRWEIALAAVLLLVATAVIVAPRPVAEPPAVAGAPKLEGFAQVQQIVEQRCAMCHNAQVVNKNVQLHTPALIQQHAQAILQQAVVLKTMPMNNVTQITEAERQALKAWIEAGAKLP